jgi:hypothetical protein
MSINGHLAVAEHDRSVGIFFTSWRDGIDESFLGGTNILQRTLDASLGEVLPNP